MIGLDIKSKYNKTDAYPHRQYPHQTASGRREIRSASDQNNNKNTRPATRLQEPRTPDRTGTAHHCGTEPTLHNSQLTSASGSPHKPAVQDFQYQPSRAPSRPLTPSNASRTQYHASSSPPGEPSFAVVDADARRNPTTTTRKNICIPPRTRYASCDSELPRNCALANWSEAALHQSATAIQHPAALTISCIACPLLQDGPNPVEIHCQSQPHQTL
jgi:hypothetical protein